jgi:hypothetical protein
VKQDQIDGRFSGSAHERDFDERPAQSKATSTRPAQHQKILKGYFNGRNRRYGQQRSSSAIDERAQKKAVEDVGTLIILTMMYPRWCEGYYHGGQEKHV